MEDILEIFENILELMVINGFELSYMNPEISLNELQKFENEQNVKLPDYFLRIYSKYNGMNTEAFNEYRFFGLYHMYNFEDLVGRYKHDISLRDFFDVRDDINPLNLFPFLRESSNMYCIYLGDNGYGEIYHLDEDGSYRKEYDNLLSFMKTILISMQNLIEVQKNEFEYYEFPFNCQQFDEIQQRENPLTWDSRNT
jgi:hypothetical protein